MCMIVGCPDSCVIDDHFLSSGRCPSPSSKRPILNTVYAVSVLVMSVDQQCNYQFLYSDSVAPISAVMYHAWMCFYRMTGRYWLTIVQR